MTTSESKRPDLAAQVSSPEPSLANRIEELAARVEREAAVGEGPSGRTPTGSGGSPTGPGVSSTMGGAAVAASGSAGDVLTTLFTEMRQDVAELRGVLEARMAVLEDSLDGVADRLEALARDGASTTGESLTELATDVRALDARLAGVGAMAPVPSGEPSRGVQNASAQDALADAVADALNDLADAVGESLTALGSTVTGSLEETKALIVASAESGAVADIRAGHAEDLGVAVDAAVADLRAGHGEDLTALRSDLADALDEVLERVNLSAQDNSQRLTAATEVATAEHEELVNRSNNSSRAAAAEAEVLLTEITRNGGLLASVQAELQTQRLLSVSTVEEAKTAVSRVDETMGNIAGALVRYLAERDRLLEAERVELMREVFAELATSMTPADRRRLAGRISDALNRRHDARDAERWREHGPAVTPPLPVAIQDVEELGALLDRNAGLTPAGEPDDVGAVRQEGSREFTGAAGTVLPGSAPRVPPSPTPTPRVGSSEKPVRAKSTPPPAGGTSAANSVATKATGTSADAPRVVGRKAAGKAPVPEAVKAAGKAAASAGVEGSTTKPRATKRAAPPAPAQTPSASAAATAPTAGSAPGSDQAGLESS